MKFQAGAPQPPLIVCSADGIGRIVFNRPDKKNAITLAMWRGIAEAFAAFAEDEETRVVIVAGAGSDFSAGADIAEFGEARGDAAAARRYEDGNVAAFAAIRNLPVPVVAAIDGACFGGGFGIAAACDIRIATPRATFAVPAARLGLAYPAEAMADIVGALGKQRAGYMLYSGTRIDAAEARENGFLLETVEASALAKRTLAIAAAIAANAPLSVRAAKAAIAAARGGAPALMERARRLGAATFDSADYAEGRAAFRDRRPPRFTGR